MNFRQTLLLCALIGVNPAPSVAQAPKAWDTLEKICRESPYDNPMDAAVVATVAGWQELGRVRLDTAANLYGSLWALEHPLLDIKSATAGEVGATYHQMRTQFLSTLIMSSEGEYFGVLHLDTPEFTAFLTYRQSKSTPRINAFPCEFLIIGEASFLDNRFEAEDWQTNRSSTGEIAAQLTDTHISSVSRNFVYSENAESAGLTLPDYSVSIKGF